MIGRVPRHTGLGDEVEPYALNVFIPGALAGGFLISMGLLMGDAVRKVRGDISSERRVRHTGAAHADEIGSGAGAAEKTTSGLRPRWVYGLTSAISFGLVLLVIPGATWNFFNPGGYISDIAWIWALSMILVLVFAVLGVQALRLAPEWLPAIVSALGFGFAVRFMVGSELVVDRQTLIVSGLVVGVIGAISTWPMRRRRRGTNVPPSVRPILTRTPLSHRS